MKGFLPVTLLRIIVPLTIASHVAAAEEDVRGVAFRPQELKVIEEKCLACHNRQRIDNVVRERRDMEKVLRQMETKGVALTEKDRAVIGHFGQQSPFRDKGRSPPTPQDAPIFLK